MKSITAALLLSVATLVTGSTLTIPISVFDNADQLTSVIMTKRYLQRRVLGAAPLTNLYSDTLYTVPVTLGNPPQPFSLAIDTGSPYTWVTSNTCTGAGCQNVINHFNCNLSPTCKVHPTPLNSSYVSGTGVFGIFVQDTYNIGSLQFTGIAGVANVDDVQLPPTADGILGLWYYPRIGASTILNVLKNSTALTQPVVGIWMQAATIQGATAPGGEITFGGVNPQRYTGDITYIDCVAEHPWTIPLGGMRIGNTIIPTTGILAAIDTGTSAMLMPKSYADQINSAIPGALQALNLNGLWILPCNGTTPITFTFGTFVANIPYSSLAMQNRRFQVTGRPGSYCQSSAMFPTGVVVPIEEWLFGASFLTTVYSVFDFGNNEAGGGRIGFANLATAGSPPGTNGTTGNGGQGGDTNNNGTNGNSGSSNGTGSGGNTQNAASSVIPASNIAMQAVVLLVAAIAAMI
ncbi:MAG: aspartic peptidase domain-containing protein [Podila humilis]|nr:MAG: aspartic peptidase domain-containing protein [Podila humilis]